MPLWPGQLGGVAAPGSNRAQTATIQTASQLLNTGVARQPDPQDKVASQIAIGNGICPRCRAPCRAFGLTVQMQAWTPMLAQAVRAAYTGPRGPQAKPDPKQTRAEPAALQQAEVLITDVPAWSCHRCAYVAISTATEAVLGIVRQHYTIPQGTTHVSWAQITAWIATREEADHGNSCRESDGTE